MDRTEPVRSRAFGEEYTPSPLDQFGVWLSGQQVRRRLDGFAGKRIADLGCGYHATLSRNVLGEVEHAILVDVSLAPDLKAHPRIQVIEGELPAAVAKIEAGAVDVVLLLSVLEHLWEPLDTLEECRRILRPGGVCLVNVPSWRGKRALEFSAFRLGLSPREEMDDHKAYYNPEDLWPLLVQAGFVPHNIRCFKHKFGLNTFAVCRTDIGSSP